jgi:hypothetical protein
VPVGRDEGHARLGYRGRTGPSLDVHEVNDAAGVGIDAWALRAGKLPRVASRGHDSCAKANHRSLYVRRRDLQR